ncbi:MAG: hypothetical protein IPN34_10910 [Planctomycetes bacterium]|nr:hypothetical protein [Planctomycetota bacterium]
MALRFDFLAYGAAAALGCAALVGAWLALAPPPRETRAAAVLAAAEVPSSPDAPRVAEGREPSASALERRSESSSGTPLEVLVRDAETGLALFEARVSLWIEGAAPRELAPWRSRLALGDCCAARSDREGRAWLRAPERRGLAFLRGSLRRADGSWLAETAVIDAETERVELELRPARCERRIVAFEGCAPPVDPLPSGCALALSRHASWSWRVSATWIGAQELEILAPAELRFDALFAFAAPSGLLLARVDGFGADDATPSTAARVRAPRVLRVRARDEAGVPSAALALRALVDGELGARVGGVTDERGELELGAFFGGAIELCCDVGTATTVLGSFDLERGDALAEVVLPAPRAVLLAPRGLATLPVLERVRWSGATALGEPEPLGDAWRLRFAPASHAAPMRLELVAEGCVPCELEIALPPREREERIELDLVREAELVVAFVAPEDGAADVELQRARAAERGWDPAGRRPMLRKDASAANEEDDAPMRFGGLRPGRYRVVDRRSGATSVERELRAGEQRELLLDLSGARWAHVRVAIPEGQRRELLRLEVEQVASDGSRVAARCELRSVDDGFEVRIPGDRDLRVTALHPRLVARGAGHGILRTGFEELELALEAGAELRFRVARDLRMREISLSARREGASAWQSVRVLGWRSESHRVLGLEPGTYDLCFETPGALPVVLRAQRIPAGELDLGELRFERGSVVRASVLDPEAREGSFLYELELQEVASEAELGREPRRVRSGFVELEEEELRLDGLGSGSWRIELRRREAWSTESRSLPCAPREIVLDGREPRELALEVGAVR